jgi:hypothetical protein
MKTFVQSGCVFLSAECIGYVSYDVLPVSTLSFGYNRHRR